MSEATFTADRRQMIALTGGAIILPQFVSATSQAQVATTSSTSGRGQPFDQGWLFRRGAASGAEAAALDDSGWRQVDLPHDWSIEDVPGGTVPNQRGPFDKTAIGTTATGFTVGGEGWYRKHFRLDSLAADARVEIAFDGVYSECDIWLNGAHLGTHRHGYAPFALDLTPHLVRDGGNVLSVHVKNLGRNSRWYTGSGIYRSVTLDITHASARLARWGVAAWTRKFSAGRAQIDVTTTVEAVGEGLTLVTRLRDAQGKVVATAKGPAAATTRQSLTVCGPKLWSPDEPNLHRLETELLRNGEVVDRLDQPFGIRIITIDGKTGLSINGKRTVLKGGCIHHDNGLIGACAFAEADDRKIRLLKARGYNAVRSSHNIMGQSLLDACDRHGMLVMNEAFDTWHVGKLPEDFHAHFAEEWQSVLKAMIQSSRNRPSVFMWSLGNEVPERSTLEGIAWEWKLANAARRMDPTRPVTCALNGVLGPLFKASAATARPGHAGEVDNAAAMFLDVVGYNYRLEDIERDEVAHRGRIVVATETYPRDAWDYTRLAERAPYMLGEFLWTAMDYIGEVGVSAVEYVDADNKMPFPMVGWPWVNAWCGDVDLIGDQKAPSLYRDVVWGVSPFEMAVQRPVPDGKKEFFSKWGWSDELPSWTWPGAEGKPLAVRFYTSGDRVELWLNGAKVGTAPVTDKDKARAELVVPYAPGTLEAVAYSGSREISRRKLQTVGPAAMISVRPEKAESGSDRQVVTYVRVNVLDAEGRPLPDDERDVSLAVDGPAELIGFGSANPLAVGSYQSNSTKTFRGRALAILRATGKPGAVRITVNASGLRAGSAMVMMK